jgi:FkbM family methyltransferase
MIESIQWHTLHPRYLNADSRVLDLGANYGLFTYAIVERFGCQCVAVEPSPLPFASIRTGPHVAKYQLAIGDSTGVVDFHVAEDSTTSSLTGASETDKISVPIQTLPSVIEKLGWDRVDLLKVDIEGAEIGMLAACPDDVLRRIAQISIEFHDFNGITAPKDVRKALDRLYRLGFRSVRMSRVGHQDTWVINRKLLGISSLEVFFTRWFVRNWFGAKRVLQKRLRRDVADSQTPTH